MSQLSIQRHVDLAGWLQYRSDHSAALMARDRQLRELARSMSPAGLSGYCAVCAEVRWFPRPPGRPRGHDSLREGLACDHCGGNSRQRAATALLFDALPESDQRLYLTEQASPLYLALLKRMPHLVGSEFVPDHAVRNRHARWLRQQGCRQPLRFEDVTRLTFEDRSLDSVLTMDVLEHVPDYPGALREFARVLRPGGALVLSVPFYDLQAGNETIASLREDGSIEHHGTPEYHGDPLGERVPCFHHFGWELLAAMRRAGFGDAEAVRVSGALHALPEPLWLFRARR